MPNEVQMWHHLWPLHCTSKWLEIKLGTTLKTRTLCPRPHAQRSAAFLHFLSRIDYFHRKKSNAPQLTTALAVAMGLFFTADIWTCHCRKSTLTPAVFHYVSQEASPVSQHVQYQMLSMTPVLFLLRSVKPSAVTKVCWQSAVHADDGVVTRLRRQRWLASFSQKPKGHKEPNPATMVQSTLLIPVDPLIHFLLVWEFSWNVKSRHLYQRKSSESRNALSRVYLIINIYVYIFFVEVTPFHYTE